MSKFHVLISIKQFTEIPILLQGVDERIAWQRSWTSWENLNLPSLPLFQLSSNEDIDTDCTYLASEEFVETNDETKALEITVSNVNDRLGLLSLISDKGFSVIGSYIIPSTQGPFSLADNVKAYHDHRISVKTKTNIEIGEEASKSKTNDLIFGLRRFRMSTLETQKTLGESIEVIPQQRELMVDKNIKRTLVLSSKEELSKEWQIVQPNFVGKNGTTKSSLSRSMNLWMNSRMDRDISSRFLIDWVALDNLTSCIDLKGRKKTNKMALIIGSINGIQNRLDDVLYKIYSSRNYIAHSKGSYVTKLGRFKKELMILEWILKNYMRKELDLNQLPEKAIPVRITEILS